MARTKKFEFSETYDEEGPCFIIAKSACRMEDYLPTYIQKRVWPNDPDEIKRYKGLNVASGWCSYQCRTDWMDEEGIPSSGYYWVEMENKPKSGRGWFQVWIVRLVERI